MKIIPELKPLILASASPRRRTILERLGLCIEVIPSSLDETFLSHETPEENAKRLGRLKAWSVAKSQEGGTVIGCDTLVAVGKRVIGKPSSPQEAQQILSFLSGKIQSVISGLCLVHVQTGIELLGHDTTTVYTKPMTEREVEEYVATGEGEDKAGAYAIQESGDRFIERLEGSFDNVVGFPTELFIKYVHELSRRLEGGK